MPSCNSWQCETIRNSTKKNFTGYIELIPTFQLHNEHLKEWERREIQNPRTLIFLKVQHTSM